MKILTLCVLFGLLAYDIACFNVVCANQKLIVQYQLSQTQMLLNIEKMIKSAHPDVLLTPQ